MADTRGLAVNRAIYNFETTVYRVYDNLPAKHKHTLSELALKSVLDMRHYCNLACRMYKGARSQKLELFSLALGYADDAQDSFNHLWDMGLLSSKTKAGIDVELVAIRGQLSRLTNSFAKEKDKGAERQECATDGEPENQEEGLLLNE